MTRTRTTKMFHVNRDPSQAGRDPSARPTLPMVPQVEPSAAQEEAQTVQVSRRVVEAALAPTPPPGTDLGKAPWLVPAPMRRLLRSAVDAGWIDVPPDALFCTPWTLPPPGRARRPLVAFTDGRLGTAAARLLSRADRPLLCALREGEKASEWELGLTLSALGRTFVKPRTALWSKRTVDSYQAMLECAEWANAVVRRAGLPTSVQEQVADVAHELVTNALLSAPTDAEGRARYAHQRENPEIDPLDACELSVGVENARVYLVATDRFGRLPLEPVIEAVRGFEGRVVLDPRGGGAGLGFRRILEHSDALYVRVEPGVRTHVLSAISATHMRRRRNTPKTVLLRVAAAR